MLKPTSLRDHLTRLVPALANDPDKLLVFIDDGHIRATAAKGSLAYEYRYTLNLVVTDWADHADKLVLPILLWLGTNQPEHLLNYDTQAQGFRFEADMLNNTTADISIKLALSERVAVRQAAGGLTVEHLPDQPAEFGPMAGDWQLFVNGVLTAEWKT